MKKPERQKLILRRAHDAQPRQILSTGELARQFDVSEATIRRDFQELADAGLIHRQYGGARQTTAPAREQRGQVGVLLVSRIDKYRDPFYNMVLEGVDKALERRGYHIGFVKTLHEIGTAAEAKALLDTFDLKGMILLGTEDVESISYLRDHFAPIVTMTDRHDLEDDLVRFDGRRGMQLMVAHLAELGCRRLAYIAGYADIRYDGFRAGLRRCRLEQDEALHQILEPGPSGWTPDLGERGARDLMTGASKPDAIVCASDRLAIGAMGWLRQNGYRIPEDIAVTGFDNIPDAKFTFPPLTTVQVDKVLLGELAAERIAKRIRNPEESYLKITTPTALVVRQSCGARR